MSMSLVLIFAWLDELDEELAAQEDTFGEFLSRQGRVKDIKKEIQKLDEMRQDK